MQEKRPSLPENQSADIPSKILEKMKELSVAINAIEQSPLAVLIKIRELRATISDQCGGLTDIDAIHLLLANIFENYPANKITAEKLIPLYQLSQAMSSIMKSDRANDITLAEDYGATYTILVAILTVSRSLKRDATGEQTSLIKSYRELACSLPQYAAEWIEVSERDIEIAKAFYVLVETEHKSRMLEIAKITEELNRELQQLFQALQEKDENKIYELSHKVWVTNQRQDILQNLKEKSPSFFSALMRAYKVFFGEMKPNAPFASSALFKLEYFRYDVMQFLKAHNIEDYTVENARLLKSIKETLQSIIEKSPQCGYEIRYIEAAHEDETTDMCNQLMFTNLKGSIIANPKKLIAESNKPIVTARAKMDELNITFEKRRRWTKEEESSFTTAHEQIHAQPRQIDYKAINQLSQVALTQRWGPRKTQEDYFSFSFLPEEFKDLNNRDIQDSLTYLPHFLQTRIEQSELQKYCGTTLISSLIEGNNIFTVSVGNSIALLCIVTAQGKVILEQINTPSYRPETMIPHSEGYRGIITTDQEAEFYSTEVDPKDDVKIFVINASDGLMNAKWHMSLTEIQTLIQEAFQTKPDMTSEQLSTLLANEALERGSEDNITVIVAPVVAPVFECSLKAIEIGVFDGQNGDGVAHAVSELYTPALIMQILLSKLSKLNPTLSQGIRLSIVALLKDKNIEEAKCLMDEFNTHIIKSVLQLCANTNDIQATIEIVRQYYLAIQANQTVLKDIKACIKNHCGNFDFHFLFHPFFVLNDQMRNIRRCYNEALKNGNFVQDKKLRADGIESEIASLEKLYQVASIVLNIRLNCDAKKYNDKEKKIDAIENKVKMLFEQYPHFSPEEIIKHLYKNLEVMKNQPGLYHNRLDTEIKKARLNIEKIIENREDIVELLGISRALRRANTN